MKESYRVEIVGLSKSSKRLYKNNENHEPVELGSIACASSILEAVALACNLYKEYTEDPDIYYIKSISITRV